MLILHDYIPVAFKTMSLFQTKHVYIYFGAQIDIVNFAKPFYSLWGIALDIEAIMGVHDHVEISTQLD